MSSTTSTWPDEKRKDLPPTPLIRGEETIEQDPDQSQLTKRYTEEAVTVLRKCAASEQPFFLYLAHTMPHIPLAASKEFQGHSLRGLYGDAVEEIDWSTGVILDELNSLKLTENTIVIFTSDNGPALMFDQDGGTAGLSRGSKGSIWEGGYRVPALVRWPNHIEPASDLAICQYHGSLRDPDHVGGRQSAKRSTN